MERRKLIGLVALCTTLCCGLTAAAHSVQAAASASSLLKLSRQSATDLEVDGLITGVPQSGHRFITYESLLSLPQVTATITSDENFTEMHAPIVRVTGVYLSELAHRIGASTDADLINAICADQYRSPYPADYLAAHRPILVLKINGQATREWARRTRNEDPGPYFITQENFIPSFSILSHQDRPQVPTEVVEIQFTRQKDVFEAITPPGHFAPDSSEMKGFGIARQNCLRCHNRGSVGGGKAGRSWSVLSRHASDDPKSFARYVYDPKSEDIRAKMPGNPQYDAATLAALTAYFKSFSGK
jgi:hypothetical protein